MTAPDRFPFSTLGFAILFAVFCAAGLAQHDVWLAVIAGGATIFDLACIAFWARA